MRPALFPAVVAASLLPAGWLPVSAQDRGGLDPSFRFAPGGEPTPASAMAIGSDGKVFVAGGFTTYHGIARKGVARLGADGSVDPEFDPGTGAGDVVTVLPGGTTFRNPGQATRVVALPEGKVLVGGAFSSWAGFATTNLVRLESTGAVDPGFTSTIGGTDFLLPLPDGKCLTAGRASDFGAPRKTGLVRLHSHGGVDGGFADPGIGALAGLDFDAVTVARVARQSDGRLVVIFGGLKRGVPVHGVARLLADGGLDPEFQPGTTEGLGKGLTAMAVDGSGRVLVGGTTAVYGGQNVKSLFRLTPTGTVDPGFSFNLPSTGVSGVHAFTDGTSLVTGTFTGVVGPVVRLDANGARDPGFGFVQTGPFGTFFLAVANQPTVGPAGETFLFAATILLQSGGGIAQGSGPIRLTGSGGGGEVIAPTITGQPTSTSASLGASASFTVTAEGTAPLGYQWNRNGNPIPGATSATYTIAAVSEGDVGEYRVTVSNLGGSKESDAATLTIVRPPRFVSLPASPIFVAKGVATSIDVVADGSGPLRYRWFHNGTVLPGATTATLTLANPQAEDRGGYEVEVTNDYGSARSPVIEVLLAPSAPSWFVASESDGPGQITDLWRDGVRGVVLAGNYAPAATGNPEFTFGRITFQRPAVLNGFVGRIDDAGTPLWLIPIVADLSHSLRVASYVAVAADRQGQIAVAGPARGTGTLAGLTLGAAGREGTFVAKLDATGRGLWSEWIAGDLYERQLAVEPDGSIILTGRFTSDLVVREWRLSAVAFGAAAVFKFRPDGTVAWANAYQKGDSVGGAVDIYNVTADASGIYVTGTYNQSIRFGPFTERLPAPPFRSVGWLGKLDSSGAPQWLKPIGGSLPTDIALGTGGSLWIVGQDDPPGGQVLHGYRTDGSFISRGVVARSGGSLLARGVGVDSAQRPVFGGHSQGIANVGNVALGIGQNPHSLWGAAGSSAGAVGNDALLTGYLQVPPTGQVFVDELEASPAADLYYAGSWTGILHVNNRATTNLLRKVFVTKTPGIPLPSIPVVVQSPRSLDFAPGDNRAVNCVVRGGGLAFRWFKNGQPIPEANYQVTIFAGTLPGETVCQIVFLTMTAANEGDYACEASNDLGRVTTEAAHLELESATQTEPVRIAGATLVGQRLRFGIEGRLSKTYRIESAISPAGATWSPAMTFTGDGSVRTVEFPTTESQRYFRVVEE